MVEAILTIELAIILSAFVFFFLMDIGNKILEKLNPTYPHCGVNPREHPAFYMDKDGSGMIGNHYFSKEKLNENTWYYD